MGLRQRFCSVVLAAALCCAAVLLAAPARAEIYVIHNRDGSLTFTSRKPRTGENAELFKPHTVSFSKYRRVYRGSRLYRKEYGEIITGAAQRFEIDQDLIRAVIHAESAFDPYARSPKGAMGLMQLMPATARLVGVKNPWEPTQNIRGGTNYLKTLLERYDGNLHKALAAYNAGPQNVDAFGGIPPFAETRQYVRRVLSLHKAYRAARQNA